jgi:hypothetical protein
MRAEFANGLRRSCEAPQRFCKVAGSERPQKSALSSAANGRFEKCALAERGDHDDGRRRRENAERGQRVQAARRRQASVEKDEVR